MIRLLFILLFAGGLALLANVKVHGSSNTITRLSVDAGGQQLNERSNHATFSADGHWMAFTSAASNLVPGDTQRTCDVDGNGVYDDNCFDVFVKNLQTGSVERVSVDVYGGQANESSFAWSLSADGRFVGFTSYASNLVVGDSNSQPDVFVKDRQTGSIERVSAGSLGPEGYAFSSGGLLSADGRFVGFFSYAANLVSNDTNGSADAFVRDRATGTVERVSVNSAGEQAGAGGYLADMSPDARFVVMTSLSSNLVADDTNGYYDVFVRDRETNETTRVSISSDGVQGNAHSGDGAVISSDGRFVAFSSPATNLVELDLYATNEVFVHDRQTGVTSRASVGTDGAESDAPAGASFAINGLTFGKFADALDITEDGRFVVFQANTSALAPGGDGDNHAEIYIHDMQGGVTARVSDNEAGQASNSFSYAPAILGAGRYIGFTSAASNLVAEDSNACQAAFAIPSCPDIFIRDLGDLDNDGQWDPFDPDADGDSILGAVDNCPLVPNADQTDTDADSSGDACDIDDDNDSLGIERMESAGTCPTGGATLPAFRDCVELFVGTEPLDACADTAKANDEIVDKMPADLNDDQRVNSHDEALIRRAAKAYISGQYRQRFDLNADGAVDEVDRSIVDRYVGATQGRRCAP